MPTDRPADPRLPRRRARRPHDTATRNGPRGSWRLAVAVTCLALVATAVVACAPQQPAKAPDPNNIANLTDAQVDARLVDALPDLQAAFSDQKILAGVPAENQAAVRDLVAKMGTEDGRAVLIKELRDAAATQTGGFKQAREKFAGGVLDTVIGLSGGTSQTPTLHGTRDGIPATTGVSFGFESTSGNCSAPGGTGTLAAPANLVPDQLLTPEHDVYAVLQPGFIGTVFIPAHLTPAGAPTIAGDSGVEFRTGANGQQQMHVRVDIQDVNKGFPVQALYPIFHVRPVGGTAATETQVAPVDGNIYCYAGDGEGTNRGYFDGWLPVSSAEPGYQVIAEVVENEFYFRLGGPHPDLLLSAAGPQFFAGADRSTVHIGDAPVTTAQPISHSVGAFASAQPDPGDGSPNVLTDQNGVPSDDIESAVSGLLEGAVAGGLSDNLSGMLATYILLDVWGSPSSRPDVTVDMKYVDPHTAFPDVTDEPAGASGAIEANIHAEANADIGMQVLATPCFGLSLNVKLDAKVDIWADSGGNDTSIVPKYRVSVTPDTDVDMPWYDWLLPDCIAGYGLLSWKAPGAVTDGISGKLSDALGNTGTMTKLLAGFDLNTYLPDLSIDPITIGNTTTGSALMKPVVTNLDNAWCGASGAPPGCTRDQDLLGSNGVSVAADASLVSSLGQALGGPLGGRFPNVFAPSRGAASVDNLVTSHRDAGGTVSGLGVVVDPRLVNLALRALAQGTPSGTTTNGLIDIKGYQTPIDAFSVSLRPEVAPIMLGNTSAFGQGTSSPTVRAAAPDVRLDLKTSPTDQKSIRYSVAATVDAGAHFDPPTGALAPTLDSPIVDIQTTGGCQVNYTTSYATSYLFCGRGSGGNGGNDISSVTDILDLIANSVVGPVVTDAVGSIGLPSLDGVLPNVHFALSNVRFAERGSFLTAYADIRPAPMIKLVGSTAGYGGDDDTVRFFAVPYNIDIVNTPTQYQWEITDAVANKAVPFSYVQGAGKSAVQFPSAAFQVNNQTDLRKTVHGKLTLDQAALHVVGNADFSWTKATPVPPSNCPLPGPSPTLLRSNLNQLPGGVGNQGSIGVIGC